MTFRDSARTLLALTAAIALSTDGAIASSAGLPEVCPVSLQNIPAGGRALVPVVVRGFAGPLEAWAFDLRFDPGELTFMNMDVIRSGFTADYQMLTGKLLPDGMTIRVGGFDSVPASIPSFVDTLCYVGFEVSPKATIGLTMVQTVDFIDDFGGLGIQSCSATIGVVGESTGDVNNDDRIRESDARCAFNCYMAEEDITRPPFSQCDLPGFDLEVRRSDVNCDGRCTMIDATLIENRWGCPGPPDGLPPRHCFGQGDPCTPVPPAGPPPPHVEANVDRLRIGGHVVVARGDVARIPVQALGSGTIEYFGFDFWHSDGLEVLGIERSDASPDWVGLGLSRTSSGLVRVGAYGGGRSLDPVNWTDLATLIVRVRSDAAPNQSFLLATGFDNLERTSWDASLVRAGPSGDRWSEVLLGPGRPNPTSDAVNVEYVVPSGDPRNVEIRVYNVRGQLVRTLVEETKDSGRHEVVWNGNDETGRPVASGTYLLRMSSGEFQATRKIVRTR